mmetsp:Transcript_348/g.1172  ORF Transcript_348/g.1172 Transcript_348/m.1172 type:complete len:241 (-) Transcript_348:233-955(-)|eukprot:CAMPEP_0198733270 /NCGR_PEP_ID=MMETSP1475-20131203/44212_1 /TAXON_ID= ORGANISM="Unidentified sp., Strain CCMP1999" /NCGR_SAMPLE_ID=MMETSP1475 /ASSEMBLY_ACC=CAM_ASM_001111 /LENGTH=240 /DNA_ID=CAMNT_0044496545 /DNA_START=245 /DNA_END=967 /DNA_ORIENTATION=+
MGEKSMEVDSSNDRDAAPNSTIYVRNLNEKIKKDELRKILYESFSAYGRVLDIVALKTMKMRGQAFVAYEDVASAANAMRHTQGMMFYDKPLVVQFAKNKCQRVARSLGETPINAGEKRKREDDNTAADADNKAPSKQLTQNKVSEGDTAKQGTELVADKDAAPNKILFVQNISEDVDKDTVTELFDAFSGFIEVRIPAGRKGIAFAEFEDENSSEIALEGLQNYKLNGMRLVISFAKKS